MFLPGYIYIMAMFWFIDLAHGFISSFCHHNGMLITYDQHLFQGPISGKSRFSICGDTLHALLFKQRLAETQAMGLS